GFHFLPIEFGPKFADFYLLRPLSHDDYPQLIPAGENSSDPVLVGRPCSLQLFPRALTAQGGWGASFNAISSGSIGSYSQSTATPSLRVVTRGGSEHPTSSRRSPTVIARSAAPGCEF